MKTNFLLVLCLALSTTSCANTDAQETPEPESGQNEPVVCTEPRPQICTMDYTPVCATRDTGIRCVTTPCPTTENKTYSNGCTACSDKSVISYQAGSCESD